MLELARIVAVNPRNHSVDVVLLRTGQRAAGVPMAAIGASTTTGRSDLPPVTAPAGEDRWNIPARGANDALAILAPTAQGNWIALGTMFPPINAVLPDAPGVSLYRHASGAWHMIAPDGTVTIGHPSGAVICMGPNLTPTNPVGGDFHGRWQHSGPNASAQVGLHLTMPSGAQITIGTDGNITLKATATLTVDAPAAHFTGNITAAGEITAGNIPLRTHRHPGGNPTGQPIP